MQAFDSGTQRRGRKQARANEVSVGGPGEHGIDPASLGLNVLVRRLVRCQSGLHGDVLTTGSFIQAKKSNPESHCPV